MIESTTFRLNLIDPFGISRSTRTYNDILMVNIDGGWGEACPSSFYGETLDSVKATLENIDKLDLPPLQYLDNVADTIRESIPGFPSARAAVDTALHDRMAKSLGIPLHAFFGKSADGVMMTSFTIGIDTMDEMLRKVHAASRYSILKIKLGKDLEHDFAVMKEIRNAVGDKTLRVDANCGWSLEESRKAVRYMADLGVEYVEQPLPKGAIEELRELKKDCPLPLFSDEDSMVAADLPKLIGAVDGINVKLMKTGSLVEARRMIATARALDMQIMLGCMIETSVAITAAAHLAPFCDFLDLDGNLLISNDPFVGVTCDPDGRLHLPSGPGLGLEMKPEFRDVLSSIA